MPTHQFQCGASTLYTGIDCLADLREFISQNAYSRIAVLTDSNTERHCLPIFKSVLGEYPHVSIPAGETHKHLATCEQVWDGMLDLKFDRKSLLINLGGGMVGDLGGFSAATFKRGLDFIQVPTTLLSMVDASIGGKTGVDYKGYKNTIGLFREPVGVYINPDFLSTLPHRELLSGFAEVIKHALIADLPTWQQLGASASLPTDWGSLIPTSFQVKARIVEEDPFEKGLRKALNFGHTIGHAIEGHFLLHRPEGTLLHGEAVAWGMVAESRISMKRGMLTAEAFERIQSYISGLYAPLQFEASEMVSMLQFARQDKKNEGEKILCTLLEGEGKAVVNCEISVEEVEAALRALLEG